MAKAQSVVKSTAVPVLATWQLQNAKAKLSEVVKRATAAPQVITVNGKMSAVIISADDYQRLFQPKQNLVELLESSPLKNTKLKLSRSKSAKRRAVKL